MASQLTAHPDPGSGSHARLRQVGLIVLRVLGGLVALIALVLGITLLVLRSDFGGERLRRVAVSQVNQQIRGSLAIQRLHFGGDSLVVWGVVLRDPEGQEVARVARVEVDFSVLALLRKRVHIKALEIEKPVLALVSDEDGSNLARATAPRKKPPEKQPSKTDLVVQLDRLDLGPGEITMASSTGDDPPKVKVSLADINLFATARYATGTGALDLVMRLAFDSRVTPVGRQRLAARVTVQGSVTRFDADGDLLGGTLKARGVVDSQRLADADGSILLDIPRQDLAGHAWGPFHVAAQAQPASPPKLDMRLAVPGVELTGKDRGPSSVGADLHLAADDLHETGRAIQALTGSEMAELGGHGTIDLSVEKPAGVQPGRLDAQLKAAFPKLRSGTTVLEEIALAAKLHERDVSLAFGLVSPARVDLGMNGRLDEDRKGFALSQLTVTFPGERWASQGTAQARFDDKELSLSNFRLASEGQLLAIDGSRRGEDIAAHLALTALRLDQLPASLVDPTLRLDGKVNVDVKAEGTTETPKVTAMVGLDKVAYQGFKQIDAKLNATLQDQKIGATMNVEAPFLTASSELHLPTDPLAPGAPIDVKLDVKHLDVAQLLRGAGSGPLAGGRVNVKLRLDGSADDPRLDVGIEAFDLAVNAPPPGAKPGPGAKGTRPAKAATPAAAAKPVDLGHAHVHIAYADKTPKAELDFAAAHGGTLVVEAATHLDLSYPHVKRRVVAKKLPVRGKVVARKLDVAWVAAFNPQVVSLGGQVSADAKLAGTVGDPQVVGEVHWKNGELVTAAPPPGGPRKPSARRPSRRPQRPAQGGEARRGGGWSLGWAVLRNTVSSFRPRCSTVS